MRGYVAPIHWEQRSAGGGVEIRNGTMFFLDAGRGPFAVTARHVYQACRGADCRLGNLPFDPEDRLISQHEHPGDGPDIATFRIGADEVARLGKRVLAGGRDSWPPPPPEPGQEVFLAGYPGRQRTRADDHTTAFGVFHATLVATSVNDRNVCCRIDGSPPADHDTGGISGAPLLTRVERHGVRSWRLAGVIYTAQPDWNLIFAGRADYLLADGRVKPYDWTQRRPAQS